MYALREMQPDDQPAAGDLWARRVTWARAHGISPIRTTPLAPADIGAALPLVLTCDNTVVALATVVFPAVLDDADQTRYGEQALRLERLVSDPDVSVPEGGSLSWILTTCISDVAAREGFDWMRMEVAPTRLAAHLRTHLAWHLDATVRRGGATVHLLRRRTERSDAIRALVRTPIMTAPLRSPTRATARLGSRVLPPAPC